MTVRLLKWPDAERDRMERLLAGADGRVDATRSACLPIRPSNLERACALLKQRRARRVSFPHDAIFQEPGWDLILDLFVALERGEVLSVTGVCDGAGVAHATGLRWLRYLERERVVRCRRDDRDRRRRLVELAPHAAEAMRDYLSNL